MRHYFFITTILVILNGCTIPTTGTHFKLNPANDKEATIEILRDSIKPVFDIEVFIDGKIAASLAQYSVVTFSVLAGEHNLHFEYVPGSLVTMKLDTIINFNEGDSRYFLLEHNEHEYGRSFFRNVDVVAVFTIPFEKALPDKSYLDSKSSIVLLEVSNEFAHQYRQILNEKRAYYYEQSK